MKICIRCKNIYESHSWECPFCHFHPQAVEGYPSFAPDLALEHEGFRPQSFAQLFDLEGKHFWFRSRNRLILWFLKNYFPTANIFLEIGCGTGYVLSAIEKNFPNLSLFGSEIYSLALRFASKRLNKTTLFQMDARSIPFENEFDLIGAFDVLEHLEQDELVLNQMFKAVSKNGGIILTVPQHPFLWSQYDEYGYHHRRYSANEIKAKVERAGFRIIRVTSFNSLLFPLLIFSRFMKRKFSQEIDQFPEFKIGGFLNTALGRVCDLERFLIQRGLPFPFGGSLLLTAKKIP